MVTNRDRKSFGSRRKNSKICSESWRSWRFCSAFRYFGTHIAESFRMTKSSRIMNPTRLREMPSCSAIDLAEILRSSKISSWIWSIIAWVVTVLGLPGRGAPQMEKSPCLNWATQFLTVAYYNRTCSYEWKWMWGERSGAFSCVRHLHVKGVFGPWSSGNHKRKEYTTRKAQAWSFKEKQKL